MRLFQNSGIYPSYLHHLNRLAARATSFDERRRVFLSDRFGALHFLQPVLGGEPDAFFTNGDDEVLQKYWAHENGMAAASSLEQILLAQIEHHGTEVFYNLDPVRYPSRFVGSLPGCVKKTICWRAAPSGGADLSAYDLLVCNFPSILADWKAKGCRVQTFFPAIDPVMDEYGADERPIDILFVGGYSRHHATRAKILERIAGLGASRQVVYCLDASRLTRLAESPFGRLLPLRKHRRPAAVSHLARPPVFGRQLYELIGRSKIVLNGAIDMAGRDRGNMRCFEAMGCGALLVSDAGSYPPGMEPDVTIKVYDSAVHAVELVEACLDQAAERAAMAAEGRRQVSQLYSKSLQWNGFIDLVAQA
ncbi:glycosyltransferase [Afipia sp. GAS231]|uniref:glycosyltransferase family protein n=1 Tax=Afipia sp. GAS231 TaxID=1882747 RepID=UPI00087A187B|nr:glycosyltransferase [Afipia sp. GAS231]SDN36502.1 Glycosyl transferases group 1 [Afipia sp. GAS231]